MGRQPGEAESTAGAHEGAPFLPLGILHSQAHLWVGLGALFAWVQLLICFEGVLRDVVVERGGMVHDPFLVALTLSAGAGLLLDAHRTPPAEKTVRPFALLPCAVASLTSGAACLVTAWWPDAATPLVLALGIACGLFIAWATLAWAPLLSDLDLRATLLVVFAASCAQWLPLAILGILGLTSRMVLMAVLPILSCWPVLDQARTAETPATRPAPPRHTPIDALDLELPRLCAALFLVSAVIQFIWGFFIKMLPGRLDPGLFAAVFSVVALVALGVMAVCTLIMNARAAYRLELVWRMSLLASACGVAACATVAASDAPTGLVFWSYTLVYVGFSLLTPAAWLLSLGMAAMRGTPAHTVLGRVAGAQYLGIACGFLLLTWLAGSAIPVREGTAATSIVPFVVLACVFTLIAAHTLVFPERSIIGLAPVLFGMSAETVAARCADLAREAGLTPREAQVLELLARGRDAAHIAEALGISRATAGVHRRNIYAKLDVHSQQELLSLIEG